MSLEQALDTTNFELNFGEYIQAIRDLRILGLSALAGYFEDKFQPDYPNFVRARWCRVKNIVPQDHVSREAGKRPDWKTVNPKTGGGRISKTKDMAVILGTETAYEDFTWEHDRWDMLPAAVFSYRGVARVGILPGSFGQLDNYRNAVAMLIGRNQFEAAMGTMYLRIKNHGESKYPSRADFRFGTLFIPNGIELLDVVKADELPETVPLV